MLFIFLSFYLEVNIVFANTNLYFTMTLKPATTQQNNPVTPMFVCLLGGTFIFILENPSALA